MLNKQNSTTLFLVLIALFLTISTTQATDWRIWKSTAGTEIEGRLLETSDTSVVLELRTGKRLTVAQNLLSVEDRKFLEQAQSAALEEVLRQDNEASTDEKGVPGFPVEAGKISDAIPCQAAPEWSYYVYLPKAFRSSQRHPVIYVMDPGGGKTSTVQRYVEAAERHRAIIAVSKDARNKFGPSDKAVQAMVADVRSRLPVFAELSFGSGFSGGSRMAYLLAESDPTIAGIIACGSGMGVYLDEANTKLCRDAKLRKGLPVSCLMGANCFNRSEAVHSHSTFDATRCRLTFFKGNHTWASPTMIADGFSFVLGVALKDQIKPAPALREQQLHYSRSVWRRTLEPDVRPWERADCLKFLAGFQGEPLVRSAAAQAVARLSKQQEVVEGLRANEVISHFASKYYMLYEWNKNPNPEREAEAEALAGKLGSLPQAEILRSLAKPKA